MTSQSSSLSPMGKGPITVMRVVAAIAILCFICAISWVGWFYSAHRSTYTQKPWSTILCAEGKTYVLSGMETKIVPHFQIHGVYEPSTHAIRREFVIREYGPEGQFLGKYDQKYESMEHWCEYDYFPDSNTLVATYDSFGPGFSNLTNGKEFNVKGFTCNLGQIQSRFALTQTHGANQFFIYDKITGTEKALSAEVAAFAGTEYAEYFVLENGTFLAKVADNYGAKHFVITTWDLARNAPGPATPEINYGKYSEIKVHFVARWDDGLAFVFGAPWSDGRHGLTEVIYAKGKLVTHSFPALEGTVAPNGKAAVTIYGVIDYRHAPNRWSVVQVDLATGTIFKSDEVDGELFFNGRAAEANELRR